MIRRGKRPDRYVILGNDLVRNPHVSFRARGILAYLLSMPEGWETNSNRLAATSPREGRDAIRTALRELETAGYLTRKREQNAAGQWRTVTIVTDEPGENLGENPVDKPASNPQPETDKPAPANPALIETPTKKDLSFSSSTDTYVPKLCAGCFGTGWEVIIEVGGNITTERCHCYRELHARRR